MIHSAESDPDNLSFRQREIAAKLVPRFERARELHRRRLDGANVDDDEMLAAKISLHTSTEVTAEHVRQLRADGIKPTVAAAEALVRLDALNFDAKEPATKTARGYSAWLGNSEGALDADDMAAIESGAGSDPWRLGPDEIRRRIREGRKSRADQQAAREIAKGVSKAIVKATRAAKTSRADNNFDVATAYIDDPSDAPCVCFVGVGANRGSCTCLKVGAVHGDNGPRASTVPCDPSTSTRADGGDDEVTRARRAMVEKSFTLWQTKTNTNTNPNTNAKVRSDAVGAPTDDPEEARRRMLERASRCGR